MSDMAKPTKVSLTVLLHEVNDAVRALEKLPSSWEISPVIKDLKNKRTNIIDRLRNDFGKVSAMDEQLYYRIEKDTSVKG